MNLSTLFRSTALAAALAIGAPAALLAAEATVKEITVSAEPMTAEGMNAMNYYPEMESDLQQAISQRVPISDDPSGYDIKVTLDKVALDDVTMLPETREFNTMQGTIFISSSQTDTAPRSHPVNLYGTTSGAPAPEGFVAISPAPEDFYRAMIVAFADIVADELPEYMAKSGSR